MCTMCEEDLVRCMCEHGGGREKKKTSTIVMMLSQFGTNTAGASQKEVFFFQRETDKASSVVLCGNRTQPPTGGIYQYGDGRTFLFY